MLLTPFKRSNGEVLENKQKKKICWYLREGALYVAERSLVSASFSRSKYSHLWISLFSFSFLLMVSFNVIFPLMIFLLGRDSKKGQQRKWDAQDTSRLTLKRFVGQQIVHSNHTSKHSKDPGVFSLHELYNIY